VPRRGCQTDGTVSMAEKSTLALVSSHLSSVLLEDSCCAPMRLRVPTALSGMCCLFTATTYRARRQKEREGVVYVGPGGLSTSSRTGREVHCCGCCCCLSLLPTERSGLVAPRASHRSAKVLSWKQHVLISPLFDSRPSDTSRVNEGLRVGTNSTDGIRIGVLLSRQFSHLVLQISKLS
jgi:hypothetical protein